MKPTPEQAEKLRELYRKNFLNLMFLAPELLVGEVPEPPPEAGNGNETLPSDRARTPSE